jgi:hypothetical protein
MSESKVLEALNLKTVGALAQPYPMMTAPSLPLHAEYYPLGFAVEIATNSKEVLAAADENWGGFEKKFSEPPVRLEIGVVADGSTKCPPVPDWRTRGNLFISVADAINVSVCDMRNGFGCAWLTPGAVADRVYLHYHVLERAALVMLSTMYLTPLHAACVQIGGKGVLLCGEGGTGKSSLAFACARSGWKFLSDDGSFIVRKRKGRVVIGSPRQVRFRESAIELFPELRDQRLTRRASGELAVELLTATLPEISTITEAQVDYIVMLNRREIASPGLLSLPRESAWDYFARPTGYEEKEVTEAWNASIDNLLTAKVFEMRYRDLDWAVERLETLVEEGI